MRLANPQVERLRARLVEIDATEQANVEAIEEKTAPLRKLEEELHPMVAKAEYHRKREEGKVIRPPQRLLCFIFCCCFWFFCFVFCCCCVGC